MPKIEQPQSYDSYQIQSSIQTGSKKNGSNKYWLLA